VTTKISALFINLLELAAEVPDGLKITRRNTARKMLQNQAMKKKWGRSLRHCQRSDTVDLESYVRMVLVNVSKNCKEAVA
jgi:hypothetical protein